MNKINSLYIHIPFCETICDYCDFTKLQYFHNFAVKYIETLKKEINELPKNHKFKTIFIGGGTPTSLEDDLFEELLKISSVLLDKNGEFSIETNPESLSINKIYLMKKYGINRVSIGVESTNDKILKSINRNHTFNDVKKAVENVKKVNISNINIDLILGLPNVSEKMLINDIKNVISLGVTHISCYGLTVHEHTVFFNKGILPPLDDEIRKMYDVVESILIDNGFIHYEVSNWCKPNFECKHNLTYWKDEEYYAIGLGASGYINGVRFTNTKNLTKYFENYKLKEYEENISKEDDMTYFIMLNLRTTFGLDLNKFKSIYNKDLYLDKKQYLDKLISSGIIKLENNILIPTYEALMTLDQIILNLI